MANARRDRSMLSPDDPMYEYERTPEQADREETRVEIYYTLKEIERAIKQGEKAHRQAVELGQEQNMELALRNAVEQLKATRKEL